MQEPKKKGMPTWVIVLIVAVVAGPFVLGIFAAIAIYGARKYMTNAKRAEAGQAVPALARGIADCGSRDGKLPETSPAVPASLSSIAAQKYQSVAGEWADPAFACAGFSMSGPQYFQYQWRKISESEGVARGLADLNGDGTPEESIEVGVSCSAGKCSAATPSGSAAAPP